MGEKQVPKGIDQKYWMFALKIAGDFGATISVPLIIFVLGGQWLEKKYGHAPWVTIGAFLLAAVLSGKMIYTKAKIYAEEYTTLHTHDKDTKEK
ncbi:MAG: AtpZ/AtpI family protein [Candidatus Magasanikbacteria bacterium]|nr:AtpZ/AtpI family protein [Candidatus Magasanikbacteria bacterium]